MPGQFGVFNPLHKWKTGDLPADAVVFVALNEWSTNEDIVTLSASLASDTEIDFAIDRLKEDLEKVRREAKRTLNTQREKIRSSKGA